MKYALAVTFLLIAGSAFAKEAKQSKPAAAPVSTESAAGIDLLAEVRLALAKAKDYETPFRVAEQYDPAKDCKCSRYDILWTKVCAAWKPDGSCAKWQLIEERTCVDWHCHARS